MSATFWFLQILQFSRRFSHNSLPYPKRKLLKNEKYDPSMKYQLDNILHRKYILFLW